MRYRLIIAAALAVTLTVVDLARATQAPPGPLVASRSLHQSSDLVWREFRDEEGTFTIKFPGEPTVKTSQLTSAGYTTTKYQADVTRERYSFMVATFELPDFGFSREQYRQLIETSVTQAAESGNARVLSKRSFDVNGFPAFELEGVSFDGRQLLTLRRVAFDRRAYMFVVMRDRGAISDDDVSRFMDSFSRLKPN